MGKLKTCRTCGAEIAKGVKMCPHCGAKTKKPIYKRWWFWVVCAFLLVGIAGGGSKKDSGKEDKETQKSNISSVAKSEQSEDAQETSIIDKSFDTSDYMNINAEVLYEYGAYLSGEKIVTVATVSKVYKEDFRADTENGGQYSYDLEFEFDSSTINKQVSEGDVYTIAGTVKESETIIGVTSVIIEDCVIIGNGEESEVINSTKQEQVTYCSAKKEEYEAAVAAALKAERDEYVAACETVNYNDVSRNPDNYKGKQVKFSGKVIQVSEGILDSVTLRVNENGGNNTWYVTYTHKDGESRILENDWISCYGKCDGVKSYTSVLGSQVTVPYLKMEYYD